MTGEILQWIKKEELIADGDVVVAGVSGGADSVCMLLLLLEFQQKIDFKLHVVHVEHGIRGEESCQDAAFVEQLCKDRHLPCSIYHKDVPSYAKEQGIGLEEAARILRYACYQNEAGQIRKTILEDGNTAAGKGGPQIRIALAHHADDNAETMLFQMIRGSGIKGLCGMRPKRMLGGHTQIIRPLLKISRKDIERYLDEKKQAYRTDATNADTDYSRNRLRHAVMPELQKVNSRAVQHMGQSAALLQEIADYMDIQVQDMVASMDCMRDGMCLIEKEKFFAYPSVLRKEFLLEVLGKVAGSRKDWAGVHVQAVEGLFLLQAGRMLTLPYGIRAKRVYEGVAIAKENKKEQQEAFFWELSRQDLVRMEQGEEILVLLPDTSMLRFKIVPFCGTMEEIPKKKYTKWFDYDKMKCGLQVRTRHSGDYLVIDGQGHQKKLKAYFTEEKIPKEERGRTWLLADGGHIMWVIGKRTSAGCNISKVTEKILEVQRIGGMEDEN